MSDISITAALGRVNDILAMAGAPAASAQAQLQQADPGAFASALAQAQAPAPGTPGATPVGSPGAVPGMGPGATPEAGAAGSVQLTGDDATLAAQLDGWMRARDADAPLVGMGAVFVAEGRKNGVDPRLMVAIAASESALGTAGSGRDIHNAFGWGPAKPFASWQENIATVAAGLKKGYLGEGLSTIAAIGNKWAPVGASNDPRALNGHWIPTVSKLYAELGGDPGGSVALG